MVSLRLFRKWENAGERSEGIYLGATEMEIPDLTTGEVKPVNCYTLGTESGIEAFLSTHQLAALQFMPIGIYVSIEYTGSVKSARGRNVKTFEILYDANEAPDLASDLARLTTSDIAKIGA
jgi:hypothetical protein